MSSSSPPPLDKTSAESEQDNSSSANILSSLQAEKGTGTGTNATLDDEIETSSIEALNWSEVDEEELQKQKNIPQVHSSSSPNTTEGGDDSKVPSTSKAIKTSKSTPIKPNDLQNSSGNSTGTLSTSLLESINSSAPTENESSKKSVIESWASGVKDAVDRGEIEIQEEGRANDDDDHGDSSDTSTEETSDAAGAEQEIRKRKKLSPESKSKKKRSKPISRPVPIITGEGDNDVNDDGISLSNAPVLDDGVSF